MDINGDRYPDIISYTPNEGGSAGFTVLEGTGTGFGDPKSYTSNFNHLTYNENATYGFGASAGVGGGESTTTTYNNSGTVKHTSVTSPAPSGGISLNGTVGSSYRKEGFIDITGDGLPDHIRRNGSDNYEVAINKGDSSFSLPVSFGTGIGIDFYSRDSSDLSDLAFKPSGLSFSNTGSLGTSISASIGGVGFIESIGLNAGFNSSANRTLSQLMDINGDGLSDQVVKVPLEDFFRVRFNLGDKFSEDEVQIFRPDWGIDLSADIAGLETALTANKAVFDNMDIPGVDVGGFLNDGSFLDSLAENPFDEIIDPFKVDDAISYTGGVAINLGANVTLSLYELHLAIIKLGFQLIPGINGSLAVSTTSLSMQDINGDGLPDHILKKTGSDTLLVKVNSMGKAGLLNKITMPTGGSIDLEYGREGNTVEMPQNRYVLTKVTKNDGYETDTSMTGEHSYTENYDYKDGYYDRAERKFYGFREVAVIKGDGSAATTIYNNDNYYTKGLVFSTVIADGNSISYLEQENSYSLRSIGSFTNGDVKYPYLSTELSRTIDVIDSDFIQTEKLYFYDNLGNVIRMEDTGVYSDPDDDITLNIVYSDKYNSSYLMSLPTSLTVRDSSNEIIRKREGTYDGKGNLNTLRSYYNEYDFSEYTFGYDNNYGNLIFVEDPLGYRKEYTYDNTVHRYVTEIETSSIYGGDSYTSNLSYDFRYGVETSQTDSNGNTLSKEYDNFGRLKTIISPYDTGSVKAVEYSYLTDTFPWKALTKNKISFDAADTETMDTYVIIDGLNRIVSTAKEGEVYNEGGNLHGWNKSGYVVYDNKARPVEEGQTVFEETSGTPTVENTTQRPTLKTYDALDRILTITFPDDSLITKSYAVEGNRTKETVTDPLGNITETYKDIRGNIVKLEKKDSTGVLLTEANYNYNELGELLKVTDAKGSHVTFTYDILGRRMTLQSPETGLTEFEYDKADHLIRKVDANLRTNGASINYIYDTHGRIEKIDYPFMADTSYTYGSQGDIYNRAGRIVKITDESGSTENFYGELGETTQVSKTIKRLAPLEDDKIASFNYTFDYQGRMQNISYPDGEIVSYKYNRGGEVEKVSSTHNGLDTTYIENIGYDEYGQRSYIKYGNGIETKYTYDEDRRWLNNIETQGAFTTLQDIDYTFDRTGNILSIINISGKYTTSQNYEYDGLYQLTGGQGYFEDREYGYTRGTSIYTQNFRYDNTGNILTKTSSNQLNPSGGVSALNYDNNYTYYSDKPKQTEIIGNLWYLYDGNGNMIEERAGGHSAEGIEGSGTITTNGNISEMNRGIALTRNTAPEDTTYKRTYVWDEENRLKTTIDSQTVEYRYDSTGERTNKMSETGSETLYFNSMWLATEDSYDFRNSKNIYLGETRIATRLNMESDPSTGYEAVNTYYYHPDHLGSSNIVTTPDGEVFEHIEYAPFGEICIDKTYD
jgi:YD repeat-containing protein